jgi:hypothetical protein
MTNLKVSLLVRTSRETTGRFDNAIGKTQAQRAHWRDCPLKGDISDFFDAGNSLEALYALVNSLPAWEKERRRRCAACRHR